MNKKKENNKIILITGTSRGLGRNLIEYYTNLGNRVIGCSRTANDFNNSLYTHIETDISNEKNILEIFTYIRKEFSRLDILINNAVINPKVLSSAYLPYTNIETAYKINVFSPMIFCREAIKLMISKKFGRIINIGSMVTKHESFGGVLYTPTKAAINAYSRVLAKEVFNAGITVNVVSPSVLKTNLLENTDKYKLNQILSMNAINEYGKMNDITNLIDLLIKDESKALTGQVFYLGGV